MKKKVTCISIDPELNKILENHCKENKISKSKYVTDSLKTCLLADSIFTGDIVINETTD